MALGVDAGSVFDRLTRNFAVNLEKDDCLVLYTDGVTEALDQNAHGIRHGQDDPGRAGQRLPRARRPSSSG